MRQYIRHPSDVPIRYSLEHVVSDAHECLRNISCGGMCFCAATPVEVGARIHIEIPIGDPTFVVDGTIMWCRPEEERFVVGVRFDDGDDEFKVRMVEQVCYIEHYKNEVYERDGRVITSEQAAIEWIAKNADEFPR